MAGPELVVFCGLPGVGKTGLSRRTADRLGATHLRVDTVETAISRTTGPLGDSPVGYVVTAAVAADQLRAGRPVVVDAVNATAAARATWEELGARTGATPRWVEVVCRDTAEHRRRVETRTADIPGHVVPSWGEVEALRFEPLTDPSLTVDNVGDPDVLVDAIAQWLREG